MNVRDRIKELRRVKASRLRPHPKNWRKHPASQADALRGLLAEIGYADALLARELPDGSLELVDGHLRAEVTPEVEVPVLILDLDDDETAKLLALHDPLAELAEADGKLLANLLEDVETENRALQNVLDRMSASATASEAAQPLEEPDGVEIPEAYQVVIECRDEAEQKTLYDRFTAEGLTCRLLTL
ncbi:MAG: ParB N-terminal domain-containing protein [Planctomycetota bacterium]|jgi:ParB-like chromosome segregation protein Spo0J